MFQELINLNAIGIKSPYGKKALENKGKEKVILDTSRGAVVEDVRTIFEKRNDATIYIPYMQSIAVLG
jgi:hypothetical protein